MIMLEQILPFLTLLLGFSIILFIVYFSIIYFLRYNNKIKKIKDYFNLWGAELIFTISLVATLGSLYYSEILNFNPCLLCWYQRILMYPLVIISSVYLWKKTKDLLYTILPLSILGIIFSSFHYYSQFLSSAIVCSLESNCTIKEFVIYGYITIPMMALTGFIAITIISLFLLKNKN